MTNRSFMVTSQLALVLTRSHSLNQMAVNNNSLTSSNPSIRTKKTLISANLREERRQVHLQDRASIIGKNKMQQRLCRRCSPSSLLCGTTWEKRLPQLQVQVRRPLHQQLLRRLQLPQRLQLLSILLLLPNTPAKLESTLARHHSLLKVSITTTHSTIRQEPTIPVTRNTVRTLDIAAKVVAGTTRVDAVRVSV